MVEVDGVQCGYARYGKIVPDEFHVKEEEAAEISIAIEPRMQAQGVGRELLGTTMSLACDWLGVRRLIALVLSENMPSHHLFRSCGFSYAGLETRMGKSHVRYEWPNPTPLR